MRGHLYMVAPSIDERGIAVYGLRATRIASTASVGARDAGLSFEIPEDFDVRDWQKLPFQASHVRGGVCHTGRVGT